MEQATECFPDILGCLYGVSSLVVPTEHLILLSFDFETDLSFTSVQYFDFRLTYSVIYGVIHSVIFFLIHGVRSISVFLLPIGRPGGWAEGHPWTPHCGPADLVRAC